MIDAAIVGLGWWGRHLVTSIQGDSGQVRFVRAVDVNPASQAFADEHGLAFSTDIAGALDDETVDAVILTTPHSLHEEQVTRAAGAGKHVFCEKPLALSKASAERAVAACRAAGVQLGIGHERRFEPSLLAVKDLIDGGALGTIMHVEANFSHDILANVDPNDWRTKKSESPAAAMTGMGIHLTDSFIQMVGPISRVHALTERRVTPIESGDLVSVNLKFESGATGSFSCILATPFFMRYQVFGTDGWVEVRDHVRPEAVGTSTVTSRMKGDEIDVREVETGDSARLNIEAFAAALTGGVPYPVTTDEMVHNIAVLEAISVSTETGQVVALS